MKLQKPAKEPAEQLELDFNAVLQTASGDPATADLETIWNEVEPILEKLPEPERLRLAGTAIAQLAEIHQQRAEHLLTDWEESYNDTGPVISDDLLAGLVQQTMYLDISDLTRKPHRRGRSKTAKSPHSTESVVGVVEKEKILAFVDAQQEEEEKQKALSVAHEEDISAWIEAIATYLTAQQHDIQLPYLCRSLYHRHSDLSLIKIWLALLLGGFCLEQRGDFYDGESIWVNSECSSL
jgi:chromatin segregation and condensation protein Rec8/ScpA/Scc1 (kleisin family)